MLLGAMMQVALLFGVFVITSCVIYVFASLKFMNRGIDRGRQCNPSLRDWIRVNAFVSLYMSVSTIFACSRYLFSDPDTMKKQLADMIASQTNMPKMMNPEMLYSMMRVSLYFMLFVGLILLAHILINFSLLKKYRYLFAEKTQD